MPSDPLPRIHAKCTKYPSPPSSSLQVLTMIAIVVLLPIVSIVVIINLSVVVSVVVGSSIVLRHRWGWAKPPVAILPVVVKPVVAVVVALRFS